MPIRKYKPANIVFSQRPEDSERVARYLEPVGFNDWNASLACLKRLGNNPQIQKKLIEILPTLLLILEDAASPDRALINFERFVEKNANGLHFFHTLSQNPRSMEMLILLFAGSQFLSEILIRNPLFFDKFKRTHKLAIPKSRTQFAAELDEIVQSISDYDELLDQLRRYQKQEILRIGACDLFGILALEVIISQLSLLANSLVQAALNAVEKHFHLDAAGFCVLALGKLGGRELNYSSDIDLIFVAREQKQELQKVGQKLIDALSRVTPEGFLYRVDMRLRPWGKAGMLVPTVDEFLNYFETSARIWEKQAILKGRKIAGEFSVGTAFFDVARPQIFQLPKEEVRAEMRRMKSEIESRLRAKGQKWGEVKGGKGSIRDVEFVTQYLQLTFGGTHPEIWSRNTLDGLARLALSRFLPANDHHILTDGYKFLRTAEHYLQIMHNQQVHKLPEDERELMFLAKRLGFEGEHVGQKFVDRYREHSEAIRVLFRKYLGNVASESEEDFKIETQPVQHEIVEHIQRLGTVYLETFSQKEINLHAELLNKLSANNLAELHASKLPDGMWRVTIVGYDYIGELSLITGLLFVYGFDIDEGAIFTYSPEKSPHRPARQQAWNRRRFYPKRIPRKDSRKKIIDVFTVRPLTDNASDPAWLEYKNDLNELLIELRDKSQAQSQAKLAQRVAGMLKSLDPPGEILLPTEISLDNTSTKEFTVIRIDAPDTFGFLYEFTNTLALNGIYISRVHVNSLEGRAHDTLFVNDSAGRKIEDASRQNQIRAAAVLVKHFTHLLPNSPNPAAAMMHFREFLGQLFTMENWPKELASLERPEVLSALTHLLGVSEFLWEDFLRMQHQNLFPILTNVEALSEQVSKNELTQEINNMLDRASSFEEKVQFLNDFKDREMFRIDMRYIQKFISEFWQFSEELSDLGEVILETVYAICYDKLFQEFGLPVMENGAPAELSICALGKLGGREIGFASDIELMFIYSGSGETNGEKNITNAEFFDKLVNEISQSITTKRKGIFEIDLRLRPYGKAGSRAVHLDSFKKYFAPDGPAWNFERQALVKLRHIAGDETLGEKVMRLRDNYVYTGEKFDADAMRAMRERQVRQLVAGGTLNAKWSPGALVDIEFLVQGLQITHGAETPDLRVNSALEGLQKLHEYKIISEIQFQMLTSAHSMMRRMIEALRMVRGNAKDLTVPPADSDEFRYLSRRMGYADDTEKFHQDILAHTSYVREVSLELLR